MKSHHRIVLILIFAAVGVRAFAQEVSTSAVPFLQISPNARADGMGWGGAALADDAWAQYWNPGGLAFQKGSEWALSYANWLPQFNFSDLWIAHTVFRHEWDELSGNVSFGLTWMSLGSFDRTGENGPQVLGTFNSFEFALTGGYATQLADNLGFGINTRFIYSKLSDQGAGEEKGKGVGSSLSFDVGLLYKPGTIPIPFSDYELKDFLNIGLNISNIGPSITYIDADQADPLPTNFRLGFGFKIMNEEYNTLTASLDFNKLLVHTSYAGPDDSTGTRDPYYRALFSAWDKHTLQSITTSIGVEYWYNHLIALRMGYFYEDPSAGGRKFLTFGAGIRYSSFGLDFSYLSTFEEQHPLANTLRFTLLIIP